MPKRVLRSVGLLVDNEFGVLTRITALVRRDGVNIQSLAVTNTKKPELSHMMLSVECIETRLPRLLEQLRKLNCVKKASVLDDAFRLDESLGAMFRSIPDFQEGLHCDE